jgi:hypothetical protein
MIKRFFAVLLIVMLLVGCGSNMIIDGKEVETYGLFNRDEVRAQNVKYKLITGNVIWGIVLAETIIAPVYFFGFSLYEPTGKIEYK